MGTDPETCSPNLRTWLRAAHGDNISADLDHMLHGEAVFHSPIVHTPQCGKPVVKAYLMAAFQVLGPTLDYTRVFDCSDRAVLEFSAEIDGVQINGVDMIEWDGAGLITDFKVMVRPLQAIQTIHGAMRAALERG